MGRKLKLTPELGAAIIDLLRKGAYRSHAAAACGISDDAVAQWLQRGRASEEEPYHSFAMGVAVAQGTHAVSLQRAVTLAARHDWKAAAWDLERRYPKLYGLATKLSISFDHELQAFLDHLRQKLDTETWELVVAAANDSAAEALLASSEDAD